MTVAAPPRRARTTKPSAGARIAGVAGELLITLGIIVGLFVVWQLWWTDVEGDRAAQAAVSEFLDGQDQPNAEAPPQQGPPPELPPTVQGRTFAVLWFPTWNYQAEPVAEGVDLRTTLNEGYVGHYTDTDAPGELGNFAVAGHRQTHGAPFYRLPELKVGDPVVVQTANAYFVYEMTSGFVTDPTNVSVIAANPDNPSQAATSAQLTLTTCHPLYSTQQRYIMHAKLKYWVNAAEGLPSELMGRP